MKAVFRVDASLKIGTGHVMRCLTLASILKKNFVDVSFICREHKGNLINYILESGFHVHALKESVEPVSKITNYAEWLGVSYEQDAYETIEFLKNRHIDWMIVDHYSIDIKWEKLVSSYYKKLMVIDDLANRRHCCNILLDQTYGRKKNDYDFLTNSEAILLLGPKYALLRKEFSELRNLTLAKKRNRTIKHILVYLGGVDSENLTESILDKLKSCSIRETTQITVLMGSQAPFLSKIKTAVKQLPFSAKLEVDTKHIAKIMSNADLSIGASGSTTWERCCLGLPSIQFCISDNQKFLSQTLNRNNVIKLIDSVDQIPNLINDYPNWMLESSKLSSQICDGNGVNRIFNRMFDLSLKIDNDLDVELCNYINLKEDEKRLVLEMRNHSGVRVWMTNKEIITIKEHYKFLENLEDDKTKQYFLVKKKDIIVGSISFVNLDYGESTDFGIFVNPYIDYQGAGRLLESSAANYAFKVLNVKKIFLEVFEDNVRALDFYKRAGFKILDTKEVSQKIVIKMIKEQIA